MRTKTIKSKPNSPKRVVAWLDPEERQMLEKLITAENRNISDTVRHALRTVYSQRFPTHPTAQ